MIKNIYINQICTNSLSCEPLLERVPNGELLCVVQLDGVTEPAIENRVYFFHSKDDGKTWSERTSIYPETGEAVYCTELSVIGEEITAYLTIHSGKFVDWKCVMMKSFDNGYTWKNYGPPPFFPTYTFIRGALKTKNDKILLPYQTYPVTKEEHDRILKEEENKAIFSHTKTEYCESGVLISEDLGKTYKKYPACRIPLEGQWIWSEPTVAEHEEGFSMLMRKDGSGFLYRCDSKDGKTWGEVYKTDIPNPSNKPKLFNLEDGRIALIHTPNNEGLPEKVFAKRYPLELWISKDNMTTWSEKFQLTTFPGSYCYVDGFVEDGHIKFVIEHNRHTTLFFDIEL